MKLKEPNNYGIGTGSRMREGRMGMQVKQSERRVLVKNRWSNNNAKFF